MTVKWLLLSCDTKQKMTLQDANYVEQEGIIATIIEL